MQDSEKWEIVPEDEDPGLEDWDPSDDYMVQEEEESNDENSDHQYRDSVTGEKLPPDMVRAACQEEVDFMDSWGIGELRPIPEAKQVTGKSPITGKWVLRNKRDKTNPLIRCRYVAREISKYKDDSLFAATPHSRRLDPFYHGQQLWIQKT